MKAGAGQDLIVVTFDVRQAAGGGGLPVRTVWVLDSQGQRHPSLLKSDFPLGQEEHETREMVFVVPARVKPVKVRFELGLDDAAFGRSGEALRRSLQGGRQLTRHEAYAVIERGGVSTAGQRGIHILAHLAQQGLLCFGARQGRQPTFVLLDDWVPAGKPLPRDQALATLATRYFASHGPATVQDFAWWSGLLVKDALAGIEAAGAQLIGKDRDGRGWRSVAAKPARPWRAPLAALLPPWDEYIVAYQDREGTVRHRRGQENRLQTVGSSLIVIDGLVRGTWKRTLSASRVGVAFDFWGKPAAAEQRAVQEAALRYGLFLGKEVEGASGEGRGSSRIWGQRMSRR